MDLARDWTRWLWSDNIVVCWTDGHNQRKRVSQSIDGADEVTRPDQ